MYRFTTKDGQTARVDPTTVRAITPAGNRTGYVKLVLEGGHAVTVQGDVEGLHEILMTYRLHPVKDVETEGSPLPDARRALREWERQRNADNAASAVPPHDYRNAGTAGASGPKDGASGPQE